MDGVRAALHGYARRYVELELKPNAARAEEIVRLLIAATDRTQTPSEARVAMLVGIFLRMAGELEACRPARP